MSSSNSPPRDAATLPHDRKRRRAESPAAEASTREAKRPALSIHNHAEPTAEGAQCDWIAAGRAAVQAIMAYKAFCRVRIPEFEETTAASDRNIIARCSVCRRDLVVLAPVYSVDAVLQEHDPGCIPVADEDMSTSGDEATADEESEMSEESDADKENRG